MNLGRLLVNSALRRPDAPALTQGGATRTYAGFASRTAQLTRGLGSLGVGHGDRVAVLMRNTPELLETMFACFTGGYGWVPLNAKFTSAEVAYHVGDSGAKVVITDVEGLDVVLGADLSGVAVVSTGAAPGDVVGYDDLLAGFDGGLFVADVGRDDLAWLFYTSGTTGKPKGAMLTHGVLDFAVASWLADLTPLDDDDVTMHAAPLTHGAGFHAMAAVARGVHQVISSPGRFEPAEILSLMANAGVTNTWLVPTQIVMLVDAARADPPALPSLARIVYGGAAFAVPDLKDAISVFGPRFVQLYGQGETPMTATVLPPSAHAAAIAGERPELLASAGYARPGMDVRVFDANDREAAVGDVGEVVVRGPAVMTGYWGRPEATAETMRGGWLHTGDLGRMDERGFLFLLDRAKDMIITGGSNVYAVEIEAVLAENPAVHEVAVVGIPDRTWGELVVAVVALTGESLDEASVVSSLEKQCASALAGYKRPRRFVFVKALPRNAYGKVVKREIRETLDPAKGPK
jgi:acyl-CoA synthetase (AMP-forming)/AMP-acid ligase II